MGFYNFTQPGHGDVDDSYYHPFVRFWRHYGRNFMKLVGVNLLYALILIVIVIYNNAPALKSFRDKYNLGVLSKKLLKSKNDPAHVHDDEAKWDVVPTKISMDEILSIDVTPQNLSADKEKGGKR